MWKIVRGVIGIIRRRLEACPSHRLGTRTTRRLSRSVPPFAEADWRWVYLRKNLRTEPRSIALT